MTIPATGSRFFTAGDGTTVNFSFPRLYLAKSDVRVYVIDSAGTAVLKVLNSDYLLTPADNPSGGTVTFFTAPAAGTTVFITRATELTQNLDLDNVTEFPRASIEAGFDRAMAAIDETAQDIARTLRVKSTENFSLATLPGVTGRSSRLLGFDAAGQVATYPIATTTATSQYEDYLSTLLAVNPLEDRFGAVGDGTTDDSAAVQDALDYVRDTPGTKLQTTAANGHFIGSAQLTFVGLAGGNPLIWECPNRESGGHLIVSYTTQRTALTCSMPSANTDRAMSINGLKILHRGASSGQFGTGIEMFYEDRGDGEPGLPSEIINCLFDSEAGAAGSWKYGVYAYNSPAQRIEYNRFRGVAGLASTKTGRGIRCGTWLNGPKISGNKIRGFEVGISCSDENLDYETGTPSTPKTEMQAEGYHIIGNHIQNCDYGIDVDLSDVEIAWHIALNKIHCIKGRIRARNLKNVTCVDNSLTLALSTFPSTDIELWTDDGATSPTLNTGKLNWTIEGNRSEGTPVVRLKIVAVARGATTVITYDAADDDTELANNQAFYIDGCTGTVELNGRPFLTAAINKSANTIELMDYYTGLAVNSTAWGAYSGTAGRAESYFRFVEVKSGDGVLVNGNFLGNHHVGVHTWPLADNVRGAGNMHPPRAAAPFTKLQLHESTATSGGRVYIVPNDGGHDMAIAPEKFGAVAEKSDIITAAANRLAFIAALDSGLPIRGGKRRFYVSGNIEPVAYCDLAQVRLTQIAPATTAIRTLHVSGLASWNIREVEVDMGGLFTGGDMDDNAGIRINGGQGVIRDCVVFNGGASSAITIIGASRFDCSGNTVRDMTWNLTGITDDIMQGIWLYQCSKFTATKNRVYNMTGINTGVATRRYTRGFSISGCTDFVIGMNEVNGADQGIDLSGTPGNRQGIVSENLLYNLGTYGIKGANTAADITIASNIIKYAGFVGIVLSPQGSAPVAPAIQTQRIRVTGNQIYRTGSFDNAGTVIANSDYAASATKSGIRVLSDAFDLTYPRNVAVESNDIYDDQTRMNYGVSSEVPVSQAVAVGNSAVGRNQITGASVADYLNIVMPFVHVRNVNVLSVPNDTWTTVLFDNDQYDPAVQHDTASDTDRIQVLTSGLYLIEGTCEFNTSATGRRGIRFQQSGSTLAATTNFVADGSTSGAVEQKVTSMARLNKGSYVTMQINQGSGGALDSAARHLKMTLIHEGV